MSQNLHTMIRPKVIIKKFDGTGSNFFEYNAFAPPASGPRLIALTVEDQELEAAPFSMTIEDSGNLLDSRVGNGNYVQILLGSTQGGLTPFVSGYVRSVRDSFPDTGAKEVTLNGFSSLIRTEERYLDFHKCAMRQIDGITPDLTDPEMKASVLFRKAFTDIDAFPFGSPLPFTTTGIQDIEERIASMNEPLVLMKNVLSNIAEAGGLIYGIDANNDVFLRYANLSDSGVTLRGTDGDPNILISDQNTGWFLGPWQYIKSIKKGDGYANSLIGIGGTQLDMDVDQWTNNNFVDCYTNARAMQFDPQLIRLDMLHLILSRKGTLNFDVKGEIRLDKANKPEGDLIGTFIIHGQDPASQLNSLADQTAGEIMDIDLSISEKRLQIDKLHWLVITKQGDVNKHVRWHHDAGTSGVNASKPASTWTTTTNSYKLCARTFRSRKLRTFLSNPDAVAKIDRIEHAIPAPWINEQRAMDTLLTSILQYSSQQQLIFDRMTVYGPTVPLNAGKLIQIIEPRSNLSVSAEIKSVRYSFDARRQGLGTRYVDIEPIGFLPL